MPSIGDFVGLPFQVRGRSRTGVDCWGLACLVYRECLGIELPSYDDSYTNLSAAELADRAVIINAERSRWIAVMTTFDVRQFDCVLFTRGGMPAHVGIVVRYGVMLHVHEGIESVIEEYTSPKWRPRLEGHFRYD